MLPAFAKPADALRFSGLLLLFVALPVVLKVVGLPPRARVYDGITERAGPYAFVRHQLVDDTAAIDIAFVGSSVMKEAIDADRVQRDMVAHFGPNVNVRLMPFVFQGFDLQYALIRDLLERRRVKILVTTFSGQHRLSNRPHAELHRFLRYGDYPDAFRGLGFADRVAVYASNVLGAPRELVSLIRRDRPMMLTDTRRSMTYRTTGSEPPGHPAPAIVLSDSTAFQFDLAANGLTDRERYFIRRIGELVAEHHVQLVVVNLPTPDDAERNRIWERADWRQILPATTFVVGFKPDALFPPGVPKRRFYGDEAHLNIDGQSCLTRSLSPFLLDVYGSLSRIH